MLVLAFLSTLRSFVCPLLVCLADDAGSAAAAAVRPRSGPQGAADVVHCTRRSEAIHNLTVYGTEIVYTVASPDGTRASSHVDTSTSFVFQLYNSVLDVDAQCSAHVAPTPVTDKATVDAPAAAAAAAAAWHTCFVESHDTRIHASFRFDLARGQLTVNETWVCDDDDATGPSSTGVPFQALGTNNISILCAETVDAAIGQHYCAEIPSLPLPVTVRRRDRPRGNGQP